MKKIIAATFILLAHGHPLAAQTASPAQTAPHAQELHARWDELTDTLTLQKEFFDRVKKE